MRNWLREAREAKGMTMAEMAQKIEVSEGYYCLVERGKRQQKMDVTLLARISFALGIPLENAVSLETVTPKDGMAAMAAGGQERQPGQAGAEREQPR